ncbi:D-glycero-beta-D-manno-heptose-1,7-bisphosphate 7-phosphatase [Planctomycetes bacterium Pla163]|uniref:D,D-heptose 1,7-bisphosphate phosphatase n=1 Tax=Rohdeia mirabilis TaxID=2528008 RepID=A0A518D0E1_9BACT|nr:D-glycero-beta-D-manno-heptose-1,7-bisphosphate 7-phosphatase [Planctomycetes bacterium Pla163]
MIDPRADGRLAHLPSHLKLALLDRDGTILDETGYLVDPKRVVLLPGAARAVARLNAAGVPVAVVTNQSAIARGMLDEAGLERIHSRLADELAHEEAHVDLWLFAPYHPDHCEPDPKEAERRKPGAGMLREALEHFGVAAGDAVTIGDSDRDLVAGERAGVASLLVLTGKGASELERAQARLGHDPACARDLAEAVELALAAGR